jgi:hypothetical protein
MTAEAAEAPTGLPPDALSRALSLRAWRREAGMAEEVTERVSRYILDGRADVRSLGRLVTRVAR